MPRLPGAEDIRRDIPQSGRGIVSVDLSAPAQAMVASGEATMRLGTQVARMEAAKAEDNGRLETAYARANFLQRQAGIQNELAQDNDYATYSDRYGEKLKQAQEESSAMITDPDRRKLFRAELESDVIRGIGTVQEYGRKKEADVGVASLNETLDRNVNASAMAKGGQWDALQNSSIQTATASYKKGYITATQLQSQIATTKERFAENRLQQDFDSDPIGTMKRLGGGSVPTGGGFDAADAVVAENEGGYAEVDGSSGAPVNYGINQRAHPDVDVKSLTPETAREIRRQEYWDAYGIGELPEDVQTIVYDGVINHWEGFKRELIAEAKDGATPEELLAMRHREYLRLAKTETAPGEYKYAASLPGWEARLDKLSGNDYLANLPPEKIQAFRKKAQVYLAQDLSKKVRNSTERAGYGEVDANPLSFEEFAAAGVPEEYADYERTQIFASAYDQFRTQTDAEQDAVLESVKPSGTADEMQLRQYEVFKSAAKSTREQRNADPMPWLVSNDLAPKVEPFEFGNEQEITQQLLTRQDAALVGSKTYNIPYRLFGKDEAKALSDGLKKIPPEAQTSLMVAMQKNLSPQSFSATMGQLYGSGALMSAQAAGFIKAQLDGERRGEASGWKLPNGTDTAMKILAGQALIDPPKDENGVQRDKYVWGKDVKKDILTELSSENYKGIFDALPNSFSDAHNAVLAYYAASAPQGSDVDPELIDTAVKAVIGEPVDVGNSNILPPLGMDEDVLLDRLGAAWERTRKTAPSLPESFKSAVLQQTEKQGVYAILSGGAPMMGKDGRLVTVDVTRFGTADELLDEAPRPAVAVPYHY